VRSVSNPTAAGTATHATGGALAWRRRCPLAVGVVVALVRSGLLS
jgi:hypothetical protein